MVHSVYLHYGHSEPQCRRVGLDLPAGYHSGQNRGASWAAILLCGDGERAMVSALLFAGMFGFLGLSVLCPFVALPGYLFLRVQSGRRRFPPLRNKTSPARLEILIPAFNEASTIGATLAGILSSIEHLRAGARNFPTPLVVIHVAADGCTDETASIARKFSGVEVSESLMNKSKWATLKSLLAHASADWVVLVDAGTIWPKTFLEDLIERIACEPSAIAIAPSYRPQNAGLLHLLLWGLEKKLKTLESICGGPVSLHGATVAYQRSALRQAVERLGNAHWLNDDVVIPLTMRAMCSEGRILYPVGEVRDIGGRHDQMDLGRRRRMLQGNLQWVRALLPDCLRRNPVAGVIAVRRVFRILWAYWAVCFILALALAFQATVWPGLAVLAALLTLSGSFRQLAGAAFVSLSAPFLMMRPSTGTEGWK